jgi:hypothetical protein
MKNILPISRMTLRRILLTGLLLASASLAFSQEIVVTLLPRETGVWQFDRSGAPSKTADTSLKVTDADARDNRGAQLAKTISWLDFQATALPAANEITISKAQLVLARVAGGGLATRPMAINVVPVDTNDPKTFPAPDIGVAGTIQSDPDTRAVNMYLADTASLKAPDLAGKLNGSARRLILLLEPTASASQRVFYGLDLSAPGLQPRLIVTYSYKTQPPASPCTSEPAALAAIQSDGRLADTSSCAFIAPPDNPARQKYTRLDVATDTLTKTPAVYRDLLYVVRKRGNEFFLDALKPLGEPAPGWQPLKVDATVLPGTPMIVDRYGRLRIVTQNEIFTCHLAASTPKLDKTPLAFGSPPAAVVPGPDGSLYVVAGTIFALNPDLHKLWQVSVDASASTMITLGPDGRFVYALAKLQSKSKFLAINAQTGQDVEIAGFPDYLTELRNPVAVHQAGGADFISVAGKSSDKGVLWIVRNVPKTPTPDSLAVLTKRWEYVDSAGGIGQPILCSAKPDPRNLSTFRLCFVMAAGGKAEMASLPLDADAGVKPRMETPAPALTVAGGNPVVDSAGNVVFWASNTLYGFAGQAGQSFAAKPEPALPPDPQLMFGPGGTLYAVSDLRNSMTVSALIPSFTLNAASPISVYSPTQLEATGVAAAGKKWTLESFGSMILGNGFQVQSGAELTVRVNVQEDKRTR